MSDSREQQQHGQSDTENPKDRGAGGEETPPSEWWVAGISTALVLAMIAFVLYDAITQPATPPEIRVQVDTVIATAAQHVVRFTAHNTGGSTGASVQISGELIAPGSPTPVERSVARLNFVPARSSARGGLYFQHDPRGYQLDVRAEGFSLP